MYRWNVLGKTCKAKNRLIWWPTSELPKIAGRSFRFENIFFTCLFLFWAHPYAYQAKRNVQKDAYTAAAYCTLYSIDLQSKTWFEIRLLLLLLWLNNRCRSRLACTTCGVGFQCLMYYPPPLIFNTALNTYALLNFKNLVSSSLITHRMMPVALMLYNLLQSTVHSQE